MIEPEGGKEAESKPADWMGALKFAGVVVLGILAVVGIGWEDILGMHKDSGSIKSETAKAEAKKSDEDDAEGVADYEGAYLDGTIEESDYENVPSK